ncbi:MAG: hypothetical protein GXO08_02380 [Aquificae bacterium]|nr:hypothetical protein [Aquificota bacterium]
MREQLLGGLLIGVLACGAPVLAAEATAGQTTLKKGINNYSLTVKVDELTSGFLFLKFPEGVKPINWSFKLNGKKVKLKSHKGYYVVRIKKTVKGELKLTGRVFAKRETSEPIRYVLVVVAPKRDLIYDKATSEGFVKEVLLTYSIPNREQFVFKTVSKPQLKILYPAEKELTTSKGYTDVVVSVPDKNSYSLLLNGAEVPKNRISEVLEDKAKGVVIVRYTSIELQKGKNVLELKFRDKTYDTKTIWYLTEYTDVAVEVYPKPVADGKTPLYVVFKTVDEQGRPVSINTYIEVSSQDNLQYYDFETKTYKRLRTVRVKITAGKGFLKLKPVEQSGVYTLEVKFKGETYKKELVLYPGKSKWVVGGFLDGALIFGQKSGSGDKIFSGALDFTKGASPYVSGSGALFAKGSYKDYLITFRYDSRRPFEYMMMQDNPSTEGGPFYPVYGDKSQQFFEAKSSNRLYAKVQKGLSYLMYGDYNTDFGKGLLFNTYRKTLTGEYLYLEDKDNYRVRAFLSKLKRDTVRDIFDGTGLSGPYYLSNPVEPFTEKVWIEVRDRYNPEVIIERRELERYVDYDINYDLGYIIFHEPIPPYDENFNPVKVVVTYETTQLVNEKYTYGLRVKKKLGDFWFGASALQEERSLGKYRLYGLDVQTETKVGKFVFEAARSDGINKDGEYTDGNAYRLDWKYKEGKNSWHLLYKHSESGFYNPFTSTGGWFQTALLDYKRTIPGGHLKLSLEKNLKSGGYTRNTVTGEVSKKLTPKLTSTLGLRWNDETAGDRNTEYVQGIAGIKYLFSEKFKLSLRREQTFGQEKSQTYPTRTMLRADYKFNKHLSSFVQTEYRETEKDELLLSGGLSGSYTEGQTTIYGKQTFDYNDLDWRTKSQLGLKHLFRINDKWSIDVGTEGTYTFAGSKKSDFITFTVRNFYKDTERDKYWSSSFETRLRHGDPQYLFSLKGKEKINDRWFVMFSERFTKNVSANNLLFFAFAYRPKGGNKWIALSKFTWKYDGDGDVRNSYIGSLHLTYQKNPSLQLMGSTAFKYTAYSGLGNTFTYTVRGRAVKNWKRFYFDFHAGILHQVNTNTYAYTFGPEVGFVPFKNVRIGLGYNVNGFEDEDFDNARYWHGGFYLRFTLKVDSFNF